MSCQFNTGGDTVAIRIRSTTTKGFLEITTEGIINISTSRQLLADIAKAEHHQTEYELLVDFRDTLWQLSIIDVYQLAAELCKHGATFQRKVALLVLPGYNFDLASFFETCSHNHGFSVNAYTEYEKAMRWILTA